MTLPRELEFLEQHFEDPSTFYRKAEWLLNDFDSEVWHYSFDFKKPLKLDWRVKLSNGSLLTGSENASLLDSLKYWLIANTIPHGGRGFSNGPKTQSILFNRTSHLIDYLLLNDDSYELCRYGLGGLSEDDLKGILSQASTSSNVEESLFNWSNKLVDFTQSLLPKTDPTEMDRVLSRSAGISVVTAEDELEAKSFGIDPDALPYLRAALKVNGLMTHTKVGQGPNSSAISEHLYSRSVRQRYAQKIGTVHCLGFSRATELHIREYDPVSVTTAQSKVLGSVTYGNYRKLIYNLGVLHELGLPGPPVESLIAANRHSHPAPEALGRFRTLPSKVVFDSVKDAVELHFMHGRQILDGYLRVVLAARRRNCLIKSLTSCELQDAIGISLREFGVERLALSEFSQRHSRLVDDGHQRQLLKAEYFNDLRSNKILIELVYVYFGAVQIVVGALTARRVGELADIKVEEALDSSKQWIVFQKGKSSRSLMALRSTEVRPIEPIAAEMIKELVRFHKILSRIGFSGKEVSLFSIPHRQGQNKLSKSEDYSFARCFDAFCDYFETSLNSEGKRYYIRQHQLRRFFALLFFHSSSFGGLDTLQWMLGHTDMEHVWHYITESMSGDVLRSAKSQFVAESLHHNEAENFKELSALLKSKYGTDDFTIIDTDELEDYIEDLLEDGEIEIEPEFFTDADGEKMRVIVKVRELKNTGA